MIFIPLPKISQIKIFAVNNLGHNHQASVVGDQIWAYRAQRHSILHEKVLQMQFWADERVLFFSKGKSEYFGHTFNLEPNKWFNSSTG